MNAKVKKQWIKALRSGKYNQTKGRLSNGKGGFCCLGVLCDISKLGQWVNGQYLYEGQVLPPNVKEWAGLPDLNPTPVEGGMSLAEMNDVGKSFDKIADLIEKYL
jgi:hypothetical protein